jgi:hypothetical protein
LIPPCRAQVNRLNPGPRPDHIDLYTSDPPCRWQAGALLAHGRVEIAGERATTGPVPPGRRRLFRRFPRPSFMRVLERLRRLVASAQGPTNIELWYLPQVPAAAISTSSQLNLR